MKHPRYIGYPASPLFTIRLYLNNKHVLFTRASTRESQCCELRVLLLQTPSSIVMTNKGCRLPGEESTSVQLGRKEIAVCLCCDWEEERWRSDAGAYTHPSKITEVGDFVISEEGRKVQDKIWMSDFIFYWFWIPRWSCHGCETSSIIYGLFFLRCPMLVYDHIDGSANTKDWLHSQYIASAEWETSLWKYSFRVLLT